jgi:hypothetical protein
MLRIGACLALTACLTATTTRVAAQQVRPFEIADNSFLVEEAFNQEAGVFQNILLMQQQRTTHAWLLEFTQEWPVFSQTHQLSYTIPFGSDGIGLGNAMINYRLQVRLDDESGPAISPRLSVILPTGDDDAYRYGLQGNLPVSKQLGDFHVHLNAGATWDRLQLSAEDVDLLSPHVAGSVIWRMLPLLHPMVEVLARFEEQPAGVGDGAATERAETVLIAPGLRAARNLGSHQLVAGAALPLELSGGPPATRLVLYLSYELPF